MVQPLNRNPSRANERVGPFVQVSEIPFKGTLIYLPLRREGVNSILDYYVPSHPLGLVPKMVGLLSRQAATLTHTNQRTISHEQEFIISSELRLSRLGHSIEINTNLVNGVTSSGYYFVVQSYTNSLHKIPHFHVNYKNTLNHCVCIIYKMGCIHSVTRIRYPTLSIYYRPFKLCLEYLLPYVSTDRKSTRL